MDHHFPTSSTRWSRTTMFHPSEWVQAHTPHNLLFIHFLVCFPFADPAELLFQSVSEWKSLQQLFGANNKHHANNAIGRCVPFAKCEHHLLYGTGNGAIAEIGPVTIGISFVESLESIGTVDSADKPFAAIGKLRPGSEQQFAAWQRLHVPFVLPERAFHSILPAGTFTTRIFTNLQLQLHSIFLGTTTDHVNREWYASLAFQEFSNWPHA